MPKLTSVWDTFNHIIVERRLLGATLREIGKEVGSSSELIRQQLIRHYGTTKLRIFLNSAELAKVIGVDVHTVYNYQQFGIIKPVNQGTRHLYNNDAIKAISALRHCRICGEYLTSHRWIYCSEKCHKIGRLESHKRSQWRRHAKRMGKPITPSIALRVRGLAGIIQQ